MASKEVADLSLAEDLTTGIELHVVRGVTRDGGGAVTGHGNSRRITLASLITYIIGLVPGVSFASTAEVRAGTVNNKAIAPDKLHLAAAPQVLADGATVNWNMALGFNAEVTIAGNRTIAAPTNGEVGVTYALSVIQGAGGNFVPVMNAAFDWGSAGAPTFSTAAGKRDILFLFCYDAATPKFRTTFSKSA
jgi:hypothetical protein